MKCPMCDPSIKSGTYAYQKQDLCDDHLIYVETMERAEEPREMNKCPILTSAKSLLLAITATVADKYDVSSLDKGETGDAKCKEDSCAWWDDDRKCCGVKAK